jgi:menaquinone-dependent protoporphyrinogen oxidase
LVVYASSEGHTKKIAERIGSWVTKSGGQARLINSASFDLEVDFSAFSLFVLAGSLHQGKHQGCLADFARRHRHELNSKPSIFLSVSLSAVGNDEKRLADCRKCIETFIAETGFHPMESMPVAGALLYSQYDFITKQFMRMISMKEGGDTDTSRDYEYTDWEALRHFIKGFLVDAHAAQPQAGQKSGATV